MQTLKSQVSKYKSVTYDHYPEILHVKVNGDNSMEK